MDTMHLIDWIHSIAAVGIAGMGRIFYNRQIQFEKDLTDYKLEATKTFVTKEDQEKTNDKMFEKLDKILDKLDTKQDKK